MICNICGGEYVSLGVHLRHKHKISPSDYKEEYGLLLGTPLVDDWLSERLRVSQQSRLKDSEYKAEVIEKCRSNAMKKVGKPGAGMTRAGKESIAKRNTAQNDMYLAEQTAAVASVLREKGTLQDVRKALGTGAPAAKKIAKLAGVDYTAESAKAERDKRAAATIRAKAAARVAKVMPYYDTTKSAAEMCRRAGISVKTYKNWLAAGLIPRHPNGRYMRPIKTKEKNT